MKTLGYIIQLPGESVDKALSHYGPYFDSSHKTKKEALREWECCIKEGLVTKYAKPKIIKIKMERVK